MKYLIFFYTYYVSHALCFAFYLSRIPRSLARLIALALLINAAQTHTKTIFDKQAIQQTYRIGAKMSMASLEQQQLSY